MSTLWTPGGERPIRNDPEPAPAPQDRDADGEPEDELTEEEMRAQMAELQEQLANTPVEVVIANHAYGIFELAALHLSMEKPQLAQARLAIDALGALVDGLGDRLGEHAQELAAGLGQLRMAFVQIHGAHGGDGTTGGQPEG